MLNMHLIGIWEVNGKYVGYPKCEGLCNCVIVVVDVSWFADSCCF